MRERICQPGAAVAEAAIDLGQKIPQATFGKNLPPDGKEGILARIYRRVTQSFPELEEYIAGWLSQYGSHEVNLYEERELSGGRITVIWNGKGNQVQKKVNKL